MIAVIGTGLLAQTIKDRADILHLPIRLISHDEIDVADSASVRAALYGQDYAAVVNTAAYHRLAECEANPNRAFSINANGAANVGKYAPYQVYISTDYVFNDGGPHGPVMPGRQPRSVYGRSKLAGELQALEYDGAVVRVSGLYGHHRSHKGPSFPEAVTSSFDPMKLPTDQRFSPTYAPDAADAILRVARDRLYGIYHGNNSGSTNWAEFAENIIAATGWKRNVLPYEAHDAIRPKNSALRSDLRHWRLALMDWADRRRSEA